MVLRELAGAIDQASRKTGNKQGLVFTNFMQASEEVKARQDKASGLLITGVGGRCRQILVKTSFSSIYHYSNSAP